MNAPTNLLESIKIASPCSVDWETMTGDERSRLCQLCNLKVHNISKMTERQIVDLVSNSKNRLCVKLYRRADGTILTEDCPVGLKAVRRRLTRTAGAVFALLISCSSAIFGQGASKPQEKATQEIWQITRSKTVNGTTSSSLSGEIIDVNGAAIPGVQLVLKQGEHTFKAQSNEDGRFEFLDIPSGEYTLSGILKGFPESEPIQVNLQEGEMVRATATMRPETCSVVAGGTQWTGILSVEPLRKPMIDTTTPGGTTVLKGDLLRKLPF